MTTDKAGIQIFPKAGIYYYEDGSEVPAVNGFQVIVVNGVTYHHSIDNGTARLMAERIYNDHKELMDRLKEVD